MKKNKENNRNRARRELSKDIFFIILGGLIVIFLSKLGFIDWIIMRFGANIIAIFIAGLFFTSVFTVTPAAVILANIAHSVPLPTVALWGALGAMFGDLILFLFIRDRFSDDLLNSLKPSFVKHFLTSFHFGFLKWLSPIIGALIIASPLPNEFGLTLLSFSKIKIIALIPVSFLMNMLGIYAIVWFGYAV